jgi:hypothetical protein
MTRRIFLEIFLGGLLIGLFPLRTGASARTGPVSEEKVPDSAPAAPSGVVPPVEPAGAPASRRAETSEADSMNLREFDRRQKAWWGLFKRQQKQARQRFNERLNQMPPEQRGDARREFIDRQHTERLQFREQQKKERRRFIESSSPRP